MRNMRQYIEKWKQLSTAFKIALLLAIMVTITLLLYVSKTYSWFTRQKKAAILAPVDAPQELYVTRYERRLPSDHYPVFVRLR